MRGLMVLIDGLGDRPQEKLHGKTPFEYAKTPVWDGLEKTGGRGRFITCPKGLRADSVTGICTLLGVPEKQIPIGRAALEAAAKGVFLAPKDFAYRCNLAAFDKNGILVSSSGGTLTDAEMKQVTQKLWENEKRDGLELILLTGYRNLIIKRHGVTSEIATMPPPHQNIGGLLFHGEMELNNSIKINGLYYRLYFWDESQGVALPFFQDLWKMTGAAVAQAEIVHGIARMMEMKAPFVPGATGETDTSLGAKAFAALDLLEQYGFVLLHVNGTDEAAHRRNPLEKACFLEQIDQILLQIILSKLPKDTRLMICSDHDSCSDTGEHRGMPQPFWVWGPGIETKNYKTLPGGCAVKLLLG